MSWQRRYFKGQKVWVKIDDEGDPIVDDGRVPMRYQNNDDAQIYRASPRNISSRPADAIDADGKTPKKAGTKSGPSTITKAGADGAEGPLRESRTVPDELCDVVEPEEGIIEIYTDGACSGNPGPCGYGAIIRDGFHYRELSQYIGRGTNNIAELTAIAAALEAVEDRSRPVRIYTDSRYCIGVLTLGWKAKANRELILSIRKMIQNFDDLELRKVEGHSGDPLNERADLLAKTSLEHR